MTEGPHADWIDGLPPNVHASMMLLFPPGRPKQEDYRLWSGERKKQPDRSRPTRARNLKRFHVRVRTTHPDAALMLVWARLQAVSDPGWTMTHGDVDDGYLRLVLEYRGRGGVPSDIRKIVGRMLRGDRLHDDDCWVQLVHREVLPEDPLAEMLEDP